MESPDDLPQVRGSVPAWRRRGGQFSTRLRSIKSTSYTKLTNLHNRTPYLRRLPLPAILIILLLAIINLVTWTIAALILLSRPHFITTAALAYSLGLRHALDADHISAIDLMTRRLIATGQKPVTVGTYFSLGHSTIVIITSLVVAATAAGISTKFDDFSTIGGIIGSSVSAVFLTALGIMNAYILYKLIIQLRTVIDLLPEDNSQEEWKIQGGGFLFRLLKKLFKLIDRPWKMYPLGIMFGLGFDTSSEVALLGISSMQGAQGTSMWLILIFPILFTVGMCLIDTIDGALMMSLYVAPMGLGEDDENGEVLGMKVEDEEHAQPSLVREMQDGISGNEIQPVTENSDDVHLVQYKPDMKSKTTDIVSDEEQATGQYATLLVDSTKTNPRILCDSNRQLPHPPNTDTPNAQVKNPLTFLYYSIILTFLTVLCALIIGILQFFSLLLNVIQPTPEGAFWDGVATAGDNYDIIGGGICASFVVFGGMSVVMYPRFKKLVEKRRDKIRRERRLNDS